MQNLSTSLLLLLVALVLLWLAVTDKLPRLLDAYDVLTGKEVSSGAGSGNTFAMSVPSILKQAPSLSLPSLPTIGDAHHVGV